MTGTKSRWSRVPEEQDVSTEKIKYQRYEYIYIDNYHNAVLFWLNKIELVD